MGTLYHLAVGCADCSVIKSTNNTFLVDCYNIADYVHLLPSNKIITGVFITHQHYDHFDGLDYLKNNGYTISHLIYSPYKRRYGDASVEDDEWQKFETYKTHFSNKGSKLYYPYRQDKFDAAWWEIDGLKFYIIGPTRSIATADTRELHDASLVIYSELGNRKCLFTGDASDISLNYIAKNTNNYCNDILHASHHGSINGADLDFIKGCNANYTVISTKSGVHDNVPHSTALQRYRDNTKHDVHRTDTNGNKTWSF